MDAYNYAEDNYGKKFYKQYNIHNLNCFYENKATSEFMKDKMKTRPYVVVRGTSPGSGAHVSQWLGDNFASWTHMRKSIQLMLTLNMAGVDHIGADLCGFTGNPNAELCARWY